jgi:hypothetical protein
MTGNLATPVDEWGVTPESLDRAIPGVEWGQIRIVHPELGETGPHINHKTAWAMSVQIPHCGREHHDIP